jgi:hypothetical protein
MIIEHRRNIDSPKSPFGSIFSININVKDIKKNTICEIELI